jgi:hypothetical protein
MSAVAKAKEFELSTGVPEAVQESDLKRAQAAWQRRSDAAADAVAIPEKPYRIIGDEEAGAWFVEEAVADRSAEPAPDWSFRMSRVICVDDDGRWGYLPPDYSSLIAKLDADRPTAELKWRRIGRKRKGWFTYARALTWLREYLEPVRAESVYFGPDGQ